MSENVIDSDSNNSIDVANAMVKDPEIRKLSPGSDEYNAAVTKLTENNAQAPASQAKRDNSKSNDATVETDEGDQKKSSKSGLERRFSELTGERDEARRKASELESRLAALEADKGTTRNTEPEQGFTGDTFPVQKPSVDNFNTYGDYQEALVDWKLEKKEFDRDQVKRISEATSKQKVVVDSWDTKEKATKDRVEGYDQLVDADFMKGFINKAASKEALQYLLESDNGPDLLFELAEDDDKLSRFKSMTTVKQVAYLSRLDSKYETDDESSTSTKPTITKAPAPSKSLPKGKTVTPKDMSQGVTSFGDYQIWREQNRKKK
jgi:hypothetical protein